MVTDPLLEDPGWGDGGERDEVFLSYSHTDAVWAQRFSLLLKPVMETGRLSVWVDTDLRAGRAWLDGMPRPRPVRCGPPASPHRRAKGCG